MSGPMRLEVELRSTVEMFLSDLISFVSPPSHRDAAAGYARVCVTRVCWIVLDCWLLLPPTDHLRNS